jgi:hypothetical protein
MSPDEIIPAPPKAEEKQVRGKVIDSESDDPQTHSLGPMSDTAMIGNERSKIANYERSIITLTEKIKLRKEQIRDCKRNIADYERAAARKEKRKNRAS